MITSLSSVSTFNLSPEVLLNSIQVIPFAVFIADASQPNIPLIFANGAFEKLTGCTEAEILGQPILSILQVDNDQPQAESLLNTAVQGSCSSVVLRAHRKDGTMYWNQITLSPIFDDDDHTTTHYLGTCNEVIGQQIGEGTVHSTARAIHPSEANHYHLTERYRSISELASDYAFMYRIASNGQVISEWITDSYSYITGYPIDEPQDKDLFGLYAPEERTRTKADIQKVIQGQSVEGDYQILTKQGERRWLHVSRRPIWDDAENRVVQFYGAAKDITEQKRIEEALRSSENQLRAILDAIPDMMFRTTADGRILDYRVHFQNQSDMPTMVAIGRTPADILSEEEAGLVTEAIRSVATTKEQGSCEFSYSFHGVQLEFEARIVPLMEDEVLIIIRDVTDQKRAEVSLRQNEIYLRSLIDSQTAYNIRVDMSGIITYCNERYAQQFGWMTDSPVGKPSLEMILPEDHINAIDAVSQCLSFSEKPVRVELRKPTQYGEHMWTQWEFIATRNSEGAINEIQCVGFDISQQKRAETELREANALLEKRVAERTLELEQTKNRIEAIFNHSGDAILLVDMEMRIQQANQAFEKLFNVMVDDYFGKPLPKFFHGKQVDKVEAILQEVGATGQKRQVEIEAVRIPDTIFDTEISIAPVNRLNQMTTHLVCIIRDITQRKHSQEMLRQIEARQLSILENMQDIVWSFDLVKQELTYISPSVSQSFGRVEAEFYADSQLWINVAHPDDLAQFQLAQETAMEKGSADVNYRIIRPDGDIRWIHNHLWLVKDQQDNPLRLEGVASDITIRKQVESLQQSFLDDIRALQKLQLELSETDDLEKLYQQIIELTQQRLGLDRVGLFVLDDTRTQLLGTYGVAPDGVMRDEHYYKEKITANHWTVEVLNAPEHVKFWENAPIRDNNQDIGTGWKAASALWNGRYEVGYLVIDNFVTRKPSRPYEAELLSVLGSTYGHLIERKQTERALRASENMLKNIIENIPFRVFWKDQQSVYRGCNSLHARGNGLASTDELVGKTDYDFLPERAAEWENDDRSIMRSGQPKLNVEELIVDADGSKHWLRSNKVALRDNNGQATGILVTIEDITERKKVEAALVESENRYRIISEMISDYAFALDVHPDGSFTYAWVTEDAVQRVTGYSHSELTYNFKLYHPDDTRRAEQDFEKALLGESTSGEYRIITKAGETRWIRLQRRSEYTTDDYVIKRVYAVAEDITKRKQAEAALEQKYFEEREMQNYLKVLHDVTIQLTSATTLDEFFRLVVQFGLEQFGFDRIALLIYEAETGTTHGTYGTDEKGQLIDEHELYFEASDMPSNLRTTLDYDKRFALYDNVVLYTRGTQSGNGQNAVAILGNEEPMGWIAVDNAIYGRPLTKPQLDILPLYALTVSFLMARKREELRTLALTQRLDLATGAGSIGVWEMNVQNNTVIWDSRMFPLYGICPTDFAGTYADWRSRIHPDDRLQLDAALQAVLNEEKPYDIEFRVIWPDESTHHIKGNAMVLRRADGKPERVVGVNIDITNLKRSEQQLQQALVHEKELGELKSRFVSMASHEFRTPLAAILATTETLTIYREKMTEPQIDARLDKIRQQVGHMKNIMEDVLQLSRIQAGRVEFNPAKDSFDALCREIVDEFDSQTLHHGRIVYEVKQPDVIGYFDRRLMRQAISNLISNGLKYSAQDKSIRLELIQDNTEIVLKVIDQGIGIPPDDLKRLFEPFHRAANVGAVSGTGLGLSITKQAVELHGGRLIPSSEVGTGTTFTVVLPMNNETKVNNG